MRRREFIARTGLLAAAGTLLASCEPGNDTADAVELPANGEDDWLGVRSEFNLAPDKIHMGALLVSSHPRPVREAIERYRQALDAEPVTYLAAQNNRRKRDARRAAGEYLGVDHRDVALTDSTTMGIGLVYNGLALRPGDEILTTEHDYYATHEAVRLAAERTGAAVRRTVLLERSATATDDEIVSRLAAALAANTRVLALTWVHSSTGLKLPVHAIAELVSDVNRDRDEDDRILVCVDGVHGFGIEDVTLDELGCDFLMSGCHKWLFGPRGTGVVAGKSGAWARLRPTIPSFIDNATWNAWLHGHDEPAGSTTAARMTPGGFKAFEHEWALTDAFQFHQRIGKARIAERTHALSRRLKEGLSEMRHVSLHTPMSDELSAGIVCFDVTGNSPRAVVNRLARQDVVATTTPYADSHARLTPCIYNSIADVDRALQAIGRLA